MDFVFHIGAPVLVEEGEAGRLKFVVVDPDEDVVTDLIVERGHLLRRSIVVPASWVTEAEPDGITLNATLADLEDCPTYREVEFTRPDPLIERTGGYRPEDVRLWMLPYATDEIIPRKPVVSQHVRLGIDDDEEAVLIGRGTHMTTADGQEVGNIDHLVVDPRTHEVTHLVLHPRFRLGHDNDVLISLDQVASLSEENVRLRINRDELERAPRYQPAVSDAQLEQMANRALETQPETRGQGVHVEMDRGLARIVGDVPDPVASAAMRLLRRLHGVIGVDDRTKTPA